MKKHIIYFCVALSVTANAQITDAFKNQIQSTFRYIDRTKVTTGLLYDYGLMLTNVQKFDGERSDSNRIDCAEWQLLYTSLYSCRFNSKVTLPEPVQADFG